MIETIDWAGIIFWGDYLSEDQVIYYPTLSSFRVIYQYIAISPIWMFFRMLQTGNISHDILSCLLQCPDHGWSKPKIFLLLSFSSTFTFRNKSFAQHCLWNSSTLLHVVIENCFVWKCTVYLLLDICVVSRFCL